MGGKADLPQASCSRGCPDDHIYKSPVGHPTRLGEAALAVDDKPEYREQLALTLLKQGRPEEAEPYLRHVLDNKARDHAGSIFILVEGYQTQGLHHEALALMDRRDATFPDLAKLKEYKQQRKTSERHQDTGKRVKSAFLDESAKVGYRTYRPSSTVCSKFQVE